MLESQGIDCPWNSVKQPRRENEMKNPGEDAAGEKYGKIEELFCTLSQIRVKPTLSSRVLSPRR